MSLQTSSFNLSGVLSPPSGSVLSGQCSLWSLWGQGCGSTSSPTTFSLYEYFYSVRARWRSPRTLALMTLVFSPYFLLLFRYSGPPSGSSAFAGQGSLRSPTTFYSNDDLEFGSSVLQSSCTRPPSGHERILLGPGSLRSPITFYSYEYFLGLVGSLRSPITYYSYDSSCGLVCPTHECYRCSVRVGIVKNKLNR